MSKRAPKASPAAAAAKRRWRPRLVPDLPPVRVTGAAAPNPAAQLQITELLARLLDKE